MKKTIFFLSILFCQSFVFAQTITQKLSAATNNLLNSDQMKNASLSFCVADGASGKIIFEKNASTGLSPASTQKIFVAIAALDLLGKDFRFKTEIGYNGKINNGTLNGNLIITGYGDPTLGSWRYGNTKIETLDKKFLEILANAGIQKINGNVIVNESKFDIQSLPQGWPWGDLGNYYGAGSWGFNWHENQYDLYLKTGQNTGDGVEIKRTEPEIPEINWVNTLKTATPQTGDKSNIYLSPFSTTAFLQGSIGASNKEQIISGAMPNPPLTFCNHLEKLLNNNGIRCSGHFLTGSTFIFKQEEIPEANKNIATLYSPALDSVVYWFLQKSINFYGETLAKEIAFQKGKPADVQNGTTLIKTFWEQNNIGESSLKIMDGCGLSPQNYITSLAEVKALLYAKNQSYFDAFYKALPLYNGMKMKSGTIYTCKAFAGYQTAKDGSNYVFSIIINNYNGATENIIKKMYEVLNLLK
ncbi:MAG: D-alanyl-D-alanine carboxypeptidase/D-alanyl-D-alanine-endopeptidase [Chitinophagaceae bacterium]|jgi:D-alanyl-D-alanine carboxypeptidase/D-alanyl-D-alanine-endopeptidase (penicillin-binding protein 4)|nr:D-alanyl-D-alanine carboxypeptidase/D-alanyl-D-alanine-endopeptidase [Chitinophagaceae bacterium]